MKDSNMDNINILDVILNSPYRYHTAESIALRLGIDIEFAENALIRNPHIRISLILPADGSLLYAAKKKVSVWTDGWLAFRVLNSYKFGGFPCIF